MIEAMRDEHNLSGPREVSFSVFAQALENGVNSVIYICGMQPVEDDMSCTDIFQCDPCLTCASPFTSNKDLVYSGPRPCIHGGRK